MALASIVVIVAGLRAASSIFVPFLLAGFIGLLCSPALFWLRDRGLPTPIALIVVLLGLLGIGALFGGLVSTSINEFTNALPSYQESFGFVIASLTTTLAGFGIDFGISDSETNPFDPKAALGLVGNLAANLGSLLNNAFLLFLTVCSTPNNGHSKRGWKCLKLTRTGSHAVSRSASRIAARATTAA